MNSSLRVVWLCVACIILAFALTLGVAASSDPAGQSNSNLLASAAVLTMTTGAETTSTSPPTSITVHPIHAAVVVTTQTQQFTASVGGVTWSVDGIAGGNSTVGTISATGIYTPPGTAGNHKIAATSGNSFGTATIAVTDLRGVLTYHNDAARDGINNRELALSPSTVTTATFGKLFSCAVDGAVYAQPLWVRGLSIAGGVHNVIFVATQHDSVYAFDADAIPCVTYWRVNLLDTLHGGTTGEKSVTWNDVGNCFGDIYPEVGVTGTPVIDATTKTIYLVSASESNPTSSGHCSISVANFFHRLHALDLATGSEKFNAPVTIAASVPGTGDGSVGGMVSFNSQLHHQRSGLAEVNGKIFVVFAAHEDATPYHGWVIGYKASNVQQQIAVFNTTPNGVNGANGGIWGGGGAPAIDGGGDIYVTTGNGVFDESPPPPNDDYGDSILRLHSINGSTLNGVNLSVAGYFTPFDESTLQSIDGDLGSGAAVLLPLQTSGAGPQHLLVQTGKGETENGNQHNVYLIDRDNMGQFNSSSDQVWQRFTGTPGGLWGTPALWHNNLYIGGQGDSVRQFTFSPATELFNPTVASQSAQVFNYPGTTPSVSSQGNSHGILWTLDESMYGYANRSTILNCFVAPPPAGCSGPAILHAYNATNLAVEYWNSAMAANNRDRAGNAVKFTPPTIANGKVYVGTRTGLFVYGLLP